MKKQIQPKIYSAFVKGVTTQVKAYKRENARLYLIELGIDENEKVYLFAHGNRNSHQATCDSLDHFTGEITYPSA